jgi:hypothetical protein
MTFNLDNSSNSNAGNDIKLNYILSKQPFTKIEYVEDIDQNQVRVRFCYLEESQEVCKTVVAGFEPGHIKVCACKIDIGKVVNPYMHGIRGNWRKTKDLVYYDSRLPETSTQTNIRKDGTYKTFNRYWDIATNGVAWGKASSTAKWVTQNTTTRYSHWGAPLEEKDALGIYSAVVYSPKNSLAIAAAKNAQYRQIASYDMEFETGRTTFIGASSNCSIEHFNFDLNKCIQIEGKYAHTGKNSIVVTSGSSYKAVRTEREIYDDQAENDDKTPEFKLDPIDLTGRFNPFTSGTEVPYLVSAWVKVGTDPKAFASSIPPAPASIKVQLLNGSTSVLSTSMFSSGPIIEGWQKIEGEFKMQPNNSINTIEISLVASPQEGVSTWFDDIRIYPKGASMKTFVYDYTNNRLMAELDENNYATFFEYNEEGKLIRVKRETERGIVTVKESRSRTVKTSGY